ncbi:MAG: hypothetical protein Q4E57_06980 [Eubacteriales bacterium]|nr:hypothetical protein [Eubacteriales bacterium]
MLTEEYLTETMRACGAGQKLTSDFLDCCRKGKKEDAIHLLNRQRAKIMEHMHLSQRQVDIVDYLIREIKEEASL